MPVVFQMLIEVWGTTLHEFSKAQKWQTCQFYNPPNWSLQSTSARRERSLSQFHRACWRLPTRSSNSDVFRRTALCPLLAQIGRHDRGDPCPLLGVKRTFGPEDCCHAK